MGARTSRRSGCGREDRRKYLLERAYPGGRCSRTDWVDRSCHRQGLSRHDPRTEPLTGLGYTSSACLGAWTPDRNCQFPLPIPAGANLSYVLNDEQEGGRIAARRVAQLLRGSGTVAVLGINSDIAGIMIRAQSFESFLSTNYPGIHVIESHIGSFNVPHEQEVAEEVLEAHPNLDAVVALMWSSARGAMSTIDNNPGKYRAKVIAFDPEDILFSSPSLDSVVVQNTREMGDLAVQLIHSKLSGRSTPALITLKPILVTRANAHSEEVLHMTTMDWRPGWSLSHTP